MSDPAEPHIPLLDEVVAPDAEPASPQPAEAKAELDLEAAREALKTRLETELRGMLDHTVSAALTQAAASLEQTLRDELCRHLDSRIAQLVEDAIAELLPPPDGDQSTDTPSTR